MLELQLQRTSQPMGKIRSSCIVVRAALNLRMEFGAQEMVVIMPFVVFARLTFASKTLILPFAFVVTSLPEVKPVMMQRHMHLVIRTLPPVALVLLLRPCKLLLQLQALRPIF